VFANCCFFLLLILQTTTLTSARDFIFPLICFSSCIHLSNHVSLVIVFMIYNFCVNYEKGLVIVSKLVINCFEDQEKTREELKNILVKSFF
jgi:hypothetical protein